MLSIEAEFFAMDSEASMNTGVTMAMDTGESTSSSQSFFSNSTMPTNAMILVQNNNNNNKSESSKTKVTKTSKKRALWKMRKAKRASKQQGRRRIRRLWQLPESSIVEYTKWIQDKPEEDRTPSEERFLWKCMIRSLGVVSTGDGKKGRQERIREFVDRLEAKEPMERTENEQHFVRLYHKRRKDRKTSRLLKQQEKEQTVSWMRTETTKTNKKPKSPKATSVLPQASFNLEGLRESMNNMGLSTSEKLKHVRFAEPPRK